MTSNWLLNTERPDTILLNETSLTNNITIKVVGYHTYSAPLGPHLGSALLVKRSLPNFVINRRLDPFLTVKIQTTSGPFIISTTYSPSREEVNLHLPFRTLKNFNISLFFLGDLNPRHPRFSASSTNPSGSHLLQILHR